MPTRIRNTFNEAIMGLLFLSLLVIYLVVPQSSLLTFLCVITLAISLIVALTSDWTDLNVLGMFAALVSLIAAYFLGASLRLGPIGSVLLMVLWAVALVLLFRQIRRRLWVVPDDRVVVLRNPYTGELYIAPSTVSPIDWVVATLPLYRLQADLEIPKINTKAGHDVDMIVVQIHFKIASRYDAIKVLDSYTNRHKEQGDMAKELGKELETVRREVAFWERLLIKLMKDIAEKVIRDIVFDNAANAVDVYNRRDELSSQTFADLDERIDRWGLEVTLLEFERVVVEGERFKNANMETFLERETRMERIKAEREATRVRLVLETEVDIEAQRVKAIIDALRQSEVDITPDVVIRAIRAASDWVMESDYTLLPAPEPAPAPAPAPKPAGDKK